MISFVTGSNVNLNWERLLHLAVAFVMMVLLLESHGQGYGAPRDIDAVHIVSDRLEAHQQKRQVMFLGHVVATQGDLTIRGDRLTIFYLEGVPGEISGNDLSGRVDRIVVEGDVRISQKNTLATGQHAIYYRSDNKVVLTGEPRVQREKDFIQGTSITLFLNSGKSIVEGGPSGPVEATIFGREPVGSIDKDRVEREGSSGAADRNKGG